MQNFGKGITDRNTEVGEVLQNNREVPSIDISPTGGDMDTNAYQASVSGEEAVGGLTPTPGQNNVDKLGEALGVELKEGEELGIKEKLNRRDMQRPELDPNANR